ncbi:hypothetical protein GCM10027074_17830 [Streptomyces deserti]
MIRSAAHQGSQIHRMSPAATPPAAILAFFDMSVASFAAIAALCRENGPALPAVPDRDPETTLRYIPEVPLRVRRRLRHDRIPSHLDGDSDHSSGIPGRPSGVVPSAIPTR